MTSLPIVVPDCRAPEPLSAENERFLREAFRSFAEAAGSLERSYGMLRAEVERLHRELAQSNAGLARSLEENRSMREYLDRILDGLPCGVLVMKSKGEICRVNPEGRRLLRSVSAAEVANSDCAASSESLPAVPDRLRELLERARREPVEQEQCFPVSDVQAGECWLAVRHATVPDSASRDSANADSANADMANPDSENPESGNSDSDAASIFIVRDVSDAKRIVREREKLRREQALAEISAILAHEIRNPLGSLELFAGLLAGAELPGECRQWVEHVQAGLRTLAATVNNVLHFHNLPAPDRVPTDLGRLLEWAGGFLVPMARRARVELCLRNHLQGVCFPADRHRLEQVLLNLLLNALRAMPGGGWVEIAGQKIQQGNSAAVAICVSDTGPGIHLEHAAKIFEPGFSTRLDGAGLGLAVCRKIVEQHGGSLAAANRAGSGACFTVTFPLEDETQVKFRQEVVG